MHIVTKTFIRFFNIFGETGTGVLDCYSKFVIGEVGFGFDGANLRK